MARRKAVACLGAWHMWALGRIPGRRVAGQFRAAQPGIAADRFAREILAILKALPALAAAECQAVIPFQ